MRLVKVCVAFLAFTSVTFGEGTIKNPFLWEVSKKGIKNFYLFGTMHLQESAFSVLPPRLKYAIDMSDEVRTEIPMDMQTQMQSIELMSRGDQKSLRDILSDDLYRKAELYLKNINPELNLVPFDKMKIWALSAMLSMLENQMKNVQLPSIDQTIYSYAHKTGKGIDGIETVNEQIASMDKLNLQEQILSLESTLEYMDENDDYTQEMIDLYLGGDEKRMMQFLEGMMFQKVKYKQFEKKFMQVILYERNDLMFNRIEALIKKRPAKHYVFAFGVMHFLGKESIIEKLKFRGYEVKRVK